MVKRKRTQPKTPPPPSSPPPSPFRTPKSKDDVDHNMDKIFALIQDKFEHHEQPRLAAISIPLPDVSRHNSMREMC